MIIQWVALCIIIFYIAFSYVKHYPLKRRIIPLVILLIVSVIFALPIFQLSALTLLGLFLIERLWILLAVVLFAEIAINKTNKILKSILGVIFIIIYFYLRRAI